MKNAITQFEKENPNITVEWLHTPDTNEYASKFLALVAAGTPPDTAFVGSQDYRTYIKESLLLDITDFLRPTRSSARPTILLNRKNVTDARKTGAGMASAHAGWHRTFIIKPKPLRGRRRAPGMNPEEAWTWEQFLETARAMTVDVNGNHPGDPDFDVNNVDRWGVHWPTLTGSTQLHSAIASNGGDWIDPRRLDRARQAGGRRRCRTLPI